VIVNPAVNCRAILDSPSGRNSGFPTLISPAANQVIACWEMDQAVLLKARGPERCRSGPRR
jgi:hypothetical protein